MKKVLLLSVVFFLLLASTAQASEIMPYLANVGLVGADVRVYYHSTEDSDISLTNKLPIGYDLTSVPGFNTRIETYTYTSSGYMLKASFKPPLLGFEFIGKIGTAKVTYKENSSTQTYAASDTDGIRAGFGLRKKLIGDVGILPEVVVGAEATGTYARFLGAGAGTVLPSGGTSVDVELQGSVIASKELTLKIKRKVKEPVTATGLALPPEPQLAPEDLQLPLCFIEPAKETISENEKKQISDTLKKSILSTGKFSFYDEVQLKKAIEKIGYLESGCYDLNCALLLARETKTRYLLTGIAQKTEEGVYVVAVSFVDALAVNEAEKKPEEENKEEQKEVKPGKIIYSGSAVFEALEGAESSISEMVKGLMAEAGTRAYEENKAKVTEEKKKEMMAEWQEKLKEEAEEKAEEQKKAEEKNKIIFGLVPYGGLRYDYRYFARVDNNRLIDTGLFQLPEIFSGSFGGFRQSAVIGMKFKVQNLIPLMNLVNFYIEKGFSGENSFAAGVSIALGL